ncbi:hypothetical protein CVT25_002845 [Psilocybe cyanescens]|uniref:Uncharacterized protein n=1 Tax=Psilocybe cyanescens TaxID=93625 RepID=A0A409X4R7_PSICY|nr:hypothetical protein CVT25_002845 [Psilocybe cyanescens]
MPVIIDELDDDTRLLWFGERQTEDIIFYIYADAAFLISGLDWIAGGTLMLTKHILRLSSQRFISLLSSSKRTSPFTTCSSSALNPEYTNRGRIRRRSLDLPAPFPHASSSTRHQFFQRASDSRVSIIGDTGSHIANSVGDVLPAYTWACLGHQSLPSVSQISQPYLEALKASDG